MNSQSGDDNDPNLIGPAYGILQAAKYGGNVEKLIQNNSRVQDAQRLFHQWFSENILAAQTNSYQPEDVAADSAQGVTTLTQTRIVVVDGIGGALQTICGHWKSRMRASWSLTDLVRCELVRHILRSKRRWRTKSTLYKLGL